MWFRRRETPQPLVDLRRGYFPAKLVPALREAAQSGFGHGMAVGDGLFVTYTELYLKNHPGWPEEWRAIIGTPEMRAIIGYEIEAQSSALVS